MNPDPAVVSGQSPVASCSIEPQAPASDRTRAASKTEPGSTRTPQILTYLGIETGTMLLAARLPRCIQHRSTKAVHIRGGKVFDPVASAGETRAGMALLERLAGTPPRAVGSDKACDTSALVQRADPGATCRR